MMSVGYEASNAMSLRMRLDNGELKPRPPILVPTRHEDASEITLEHISTDAHPDHSFQSLIDRSIDILPRGGTPATRQAVEKHIAFLKSLNSLDELLTAKENPVWFFQHRESFMQQTELSKWDPSSLGIYVLLPMEGGFANSEDCVFISHYWRTPSHPDPDGEDLKKLKKLFNDGFWSKAAYLWIDWTCMPQRERSATQKQYFSRVLPSISKLVRDCSFVAQFPEFRPRLWVLLEVASFTFNRAEPVGLACADTFESHLRQMRGEGVRLVLDRYGYKCTNRSDREFVITSLEILLALRKAVPSIHTRQRILDAIDNSAVRTCVHQEAGVEIDKERGTLKANGTTYQFNALAVKDDVPTSVSEVCIAGDYKTRLEKALQRADQSFDDAGVGEMAREYDRAGDHKIAEVLHRRAVATREDPVTLHDLSANLENQEQYEYAAAQCRRHMARFGGSDKLPQRLAVLEQKQAQLDAYHKWETQPLEAILQITNPRWTTASTRNIYQPAVRHGLRRSWLQNLDKTVHQCDDPVVMKSMEERGLEFEEQGRFSEALQVHWSLVERRKKLLGPCHIDTRRSLCNLARAFRLTGNAQNAHMLYMVALAVCDLTLGPRHPESRATLGDLAAVVLLRGRLGVARSYYRQQLERTLAVVEWDDPETFAPKFFLKGLVGDAELRIVQDEHATVEIFGRSGSHDQRPLDLDPALAVAAKDNPSVKLRQANEDDAPGEEQSHGAQGKVLILDAENADFLMKRYIVAR